MQPVYKEMNRFSLVLQMLYACVINLVIEAISRHSLFEAWDYMVGSPWTFLFNTYLIFITFLLAYLVRRRVFVRVLMSAFWMILGITNGYMLLIRVTPFNAQDLKVAGDAVTLFDKYFSGFEGMMLAAGIIAVVVWLISMWRRGGQYQGKVHRWPHWSELYFALESRLLTDFAISKRVISNYFGNIAFAYEDYGFPYCFSASVFNTGISQPNDYMKRRFKTSAITEKSRKLRLGVKRCRILFLFN